jgi:hypothetical protein
MKIQYNILFSVFLIFVSLFIISCQQATYKDSITKIPEKVTTKTYEIPLNGKKIPVVETIVEKESIDINREQTSTDTKMHYTHPTDSPNSTLTHLNPLESGDESTGGGNWGFMDNIGGMISSFSGILSSIAFLIIIGIILYVLFPVIRPFIEMIGSWIAALIPILGAWIQSLKAKKAETALKQTVKGVQEYKKILTKEEIEELNKILMTKQDIQSQDIINLIKK